MEFKHVTAQEGKTFRRKIDGFIMGNDMYLGEFIDGSIDTLDNYEEVDDPMSEENKNPKSDSKIRK